MGDAAWWLPEGQRAHRTSMNCSCRWARPPSRAPSDGCGNWGNTPNWGNRARATRTGQNLQILCQQLMVRDGAPASLYVPGQASANNYNNTVFGPSTTPFNFNLGIQGGNPDLEVGEGRHGHHRRGAEVALRGGAAAAADAVGGLLRHRPEGRHRRSHWISRSTSSAWMPSTTRWLEMRRVRTPALNWRPAILTAH